MSQRDSMNKAAASGGGQYPQLSEADQARQKLFDIAELIRSLEGFPVDFIFLVFTRLSNYKTN